jgi:hypothetical protein
MKNQFKSVATALQWLPLLDHTHLFALISVHGSLKWSRIGQDMMKIISFVVIRVTLITLLITCAIKIVGTPGYHSRHSNNTLNYVYDVYLICSTPPTSYNNLQTTDIIG